MDLLADLGNTRLKWGIGQGKEIYCGVPLVHSDNAFEQQLLDAWSSLNTVPHRLALSSVAAAQLLQCICGVAKRLWPDIEIICAQPQALAFGVQSAYHAPEKLGVDRWLCLLAARHYHLLPACIVDCGTAVTVDIINAQGVHQGGVIAPGLRLMKQALYRGTQDLPFNDAHYPLGLAAFTDAAIDSGVLYACIGMIERIMHECDQPHLLLTGGDAATIAPYLPFAVNMQADLVLQGLSVLLENT